MIHPAVAQHLDEIIEICQEFGVARLELFGSALSEDFDPARSDVDFLIELPEGFDHGPWGARFEELRARISSVVGRDVDLIQLRNIENPYVLHAVQHSRTLLYAA